MTQQYKLMQNYIHLLDALVLQPSTWMPIHGQSLSINLSHYKQKSLSGKKPIVLIMLLLLRMCQAYQTSWTVAILMQGKYSCYPYAGLM